MMLLHCKQSRGSRRFLLGVAGTSRSSVVIINLFQLLQVTEDASALQEEEAEQWSLSAATSDRPKPFGLILRLSKEEDGGRGSIAGGGP